MGEEEREDMLEQATFEETPLLPGEVRPPPYRLDDAVHWATVYEELTGFLLAIEHDPQRMLDRYQRRLDYWRRLRNRLERCGPPDGQSETHP